MIAAAPVLARVLDEQMALTEVDPLAFEVLPDPIVSVGLDLSLTSSGLADSNGWVDVIGQAGLTNLSIYGQTAAIQGLADLIVEQVRRREPQIVVLEALDMAQAYGGQIERTVLWWKVMESLQDFQTATPTSAQVKIYATGNGLATKPQMVEAVKQHWPQFLVGRNNNKADAAAMAALGAALVGKPLCHLDDRHTRVLERIRYTTDPPSRTLKPGPGRHRRSSK